MSHNPPTDRGEHPIFAIARWGMAVATGSFAVAALALVLSSRLLTLPFAVLCAGLSVWIAQGASPHPSRAATWLCGIGGIGSIIQVSVILLAG